MLALPKNIRIMPSHSFDVNAGIAQLVEHDLAKVGVASSSLVSRSKFTIPRFCGGFFYGLIFPRFPFSGEKGNVFLCFLNLA